MNDQEIRVESLRQAVHWAHAWVNRAPESDVIVTVAKKFEKYLKGV